MSAIATPPFHLTSPFTHPGTATMAQVNASNVAPLPDISAASSSSLHLNFPSSSYAPTLSSRAVSKVSVHPAALFSILDHFLRRNDPPAPAAKEGEDGAAAPAAAEANPNSNAKPNRVIGTLLGVVNDDEVEIRSCFAVPHNETDEQVQVDMDYHKQMFELHSKVHPEEVIVGW